MTGEGGNPRTLSVKYTKQTARAFHKGSCSQRREPSCMHSSACMESFLSHPVGVHEVIYSPTPEMFEGIMLLGGGNTLFRACKWEILCIFLYARSFICVNIFGSHFYSPCILSEKYSIQNKRRKIIRQNCRSRAVR